MDVLVLGAGRPARGDAPSALKPVALHTRAMDWQLESLAALGAPLSIRYLGGYGIDEVARRYPHLAFTLVPDWAANGALHSLLQADFSGGPALICYSDTVFRVEALAEVIAAGGDVVVGIDGAWHDRYPTRTDADRAVAEMLALDGTASPVEFTGLLYLGPPAVAYLQSVPEFQIGRTLVDLVQALAAAGFAIRSVDVRGRWAEFNAPEDVARFVLGTKAETLARLENRVSLSQIGRQHSFTTADWRANRDEVLAALRSRFGTGRLIVRSSASSEDGWTSSNAGGYASALDIDGADPDAVATAIDEVIASYASAEAVHQILVQEMVTNVRCAGVVLTCGLETGAPYYRINFDDKSQSTDSVTSASTTDLRTVIVSRARRDLLVHEAPSLVPVLDAVAEIESILHYGKLDIEFAVDDVGQVRLFQVRPITVDHSEYEHDEETFAAAIDANVARYRALQAPTPGVHGTTTFFGDMPDWNPAEIIGARPRPLAASLYRHLVTDEVWAAQRAAFGYRDVRPLPLIRMFSGHPFVDVRASLNSFIPAALDDRAAARVAEAYLARLRSHPALHDKIEFEIAFTAWDPAFRAAASERYVDGGALTRSDIDALEAALKDLTRSALTRLDDDIAPLEELGRRRAALAAAGLSSIDHAVALIEDCRRFGTPAFAHAARAGFVATTMLNGLVASGALTAPRRAAFLRSLNTVSRLLQQAKARHRRREIDDSAFVTAFGHLRPGTYEIAVEAYHEDPSRYLFATGQSAAPVSEAFAFAPEEDAALAAMLDELGAELSPAGFANYLRAALEAREFAKFEFSRNVSAALDIGVDLGRELGISRIDFGFLDYQDLSQFHAGAIDAAKLSARCIERRRSHRHTLLAELPSLIMHESDFHCFERPTSQPNFVTQARATAPLLSVTAGDDVDPAGSIVLISHADPGFDWLFGHDVRGLITRYGGANSHMAIRAAEIGLPAAIGVGEKLFERIGAMRMVELDCANHIIREVQ